MMPTSRGVSQTVHFSFVNRPFPFLPTSYPSISLQLERIADDVRAGIVWINNAQPSPHAMPVRLSLSLSLCLQYLPMDIPRRSVLILLQWGGFKKSGIGRELGPLALYPFLEVKGAYYVHRVPS